MNNGPSILRITALAIIAVLLVAGGSFAVRWYYIEKAREEGKGLANERAIQRKAQEQSEQQEKQLAERRQHLTGLLTSLEDSLETHPTDSMLVISAANISYDLGKFDKAVEYYQRFLQRIDPSNSLVRVDYAYAMFQMGRRNDGINELKRIIAREPGNQSALYNLAVMYTQMNDVTQALHWFRMCEKVDATSDAGKRATLAIKQIETAT